MPASAASFADALHVPGLAQACIQAACPDLDPPLSNTNASLRVLRLVCCGSRDAMYRVVQQFKLKLRDPAQEQGSLDPTVAAFLNKCQLLSLHIKVPRPQVTAGELS